MEARKENKVYTITENEKDFYLTNGYTIYDENGEVTDYPANKTVAYSEYEKVLKELEELRKGVSKKSKPNGKEIKTDEKEIESGKREDV